ncbi:MAG: hypothetical protein LAN64_15095 [Acidobacteriia bacterium]|nr:hypothetical protein [Terriglobia bacterium]
MDKAPFRRPTLLRFSSDQFMEELQGLVSKTPESLRNYVAQGETWRSPAVGLDSSTTGQTDDAQQTPLKFFQPVHARFYLVAGSLVCRQPGLPDHQVKSNLGEKTTFVVRRIRPKVGLTGDCSTFDPQHCDEYAWLSADPSGWAQVDGAGLADGEERLPMSAFEFGANGSRRRLFTGLIPASRRQTYVAGKVTQTAAQGTVTTDDPRKIDFQRQVSDPWVELVDYRDETQASSSLSQNAKDQIATGIAQASALILIDFANFLSQHIPNVWNVLQHSSPASSLGPKPKQLALYKIFNTTVANLQPPSSRSKLSDAIQSAKNFENTFENAVLAKGPNPAVPTGYAGPMLSDTSDAQLSALIRRGSDPLQPRALQVLAEAALDEVGPAPPVMVRTPAKDPENPQGDDWYVVRCVYERPQCGLKMVPVISEPSRPFQLASFFDPDAPARSIQVALPIDTTPAALRKYDKGVGFMISDQLGKQMSRVKGLKQLMEGDLADPDGFGLGMICSFSIPIITICAFIVLMIFLTLLNIVFWWLPFFKICFPIPTLKAKG